MADIDQMIRPLMLQDLRTQLRARGVNPAGGAPELRERLKQNMVDTGNFNLNMSASGSPTAGSVQAGTSTADMNSRLANNYGRPGGQQNVGNFLTDKPSSRVLAPPGGGSQIVFGDYQEPVAAQRTAAPPHAQYSSNHDHNQPPAGSRPVVTAATQYGSGYQQPPPQPYGGINAPYGIQQQHSLPPAQQQRQQEEGFGARSDETRTGSLSNNYNRPGGQQNVGNFLTDRPSSRVLAPPGGRSQISFG
jgi:SPIRAL1-like protein